jgi:hypothetical protein
MVSKKWPYNDIVFEKGNGRLFNMAYMSWSPYDHNIYIGWEYNDRPDRAIPEIVGEHLSHETIHGVLHKIMLSDKIPELIINAYQRSHWPFYRGLDDWTYLNIYVHWEIDKPNGFKSCPVIYS